MDNDAIIESWATEFVQKVDASKQAFGIRHNRDQAPRKTKYKFKRSNGEIVRIGIILTKGEVMTHKGTGRNKDGRKPKPFYNNIADQELSQLADQLAENTGDLLCSRLVIS